MEDAREANGGRQGTKAYKGKQTGTLQLHEVRPKKSHDNLDLRRYLGVARVSLGEIWEVSGGWSIVLWLSGEIFGKNFL